VSRVVAGWVKGGGVISHRYFPIDIALKGWFVDPGLVICLRGFGVIGWSELSVGGGQV